MIKGKYVTDRIDEAVTSAARLVRDANRRVERTQAQYVEIAKRRASAFEALAKVLLDSDELDRTIVTGRMVPKLTEWSTDLDGVIGDAEAAVSAVGMEVVRKHEQVNRLQAELVSKEQVLNEKNEELAGVLKLDSEYTDYLSEYRTLEKEHGLAADRLEETVQRSKERARSFLEGPLFRYLLERKYGTAEYRGWGLANRLDGWVADLCGYTIAVRNYKLICALPDWQREHLENLERRGNDASERLSAALDLARTSVGWHVVSESHAATENRLDRAESALAETTTQLANAELLLGTQLRGESGRAGELVAECAQWLKGYSLQALGDLAARTPNEQDDRLIAEMVGLDRQWSDAATEQTKTKNVAKARETEYRRLLKMQSYAQSRHYSRSRARFDDALNINELITGYMLGRINKTSVFDTMDRHYSPKPSPSSYSSSSSNDDFFGGGGFGGGGFSSGGGFGGGGGFSTGGGF